MVGGGNGSWTHCPESEILLWECFHSDGHLIAMQFHCPHLCLQSPWGQVEVCTLEFEG